MILFGGEILFVVLVAIAIDALIGEPDWLWRRIPHPVVWFGRAIDGLESRLNSPNEQTKNAGRAKGFILLVLLLAVGGAGSFLLQTALMQVSYFGPLILALIASTLIAQKSLFQHVKAVEEPLATHDLVEARRAVSMIVGRDPNSLDEAGIARAAIESLAENFSDGVVAPIFWFALFGMPGLVLYKIVNTADSMIGHRNERFTDFGWASARFDDLVNLIPARLTMLLMLFSPLGGRTAASEPNKASVWQGILLDAPKHRSPNAGWPEAATAYRLDIALSGPRRYGDRLVDEPYVNAAGRREIGAEQIANAVWLYVSSCIVMFGLLFVLALFTAF